MFLATLGWWPWLVLFAAILVAVAVLWGVAYFARRHGNSV